MVAIDWVVLSVYLLIVALIGIRVARRQKNTDAYFVASRSAPWWAIGLSFLATAVSTATFVAHPGRAYGADWKAHLAHLMLPLTAIFVGVVVIPLYRSKVQISAYEYLEQRFGYGARLYAVVFYLLSKLIYIGLILFLMAKAISAMTELDVFIIIIACGGFAILYTILGGLEAVIWTDVLQSVTLFGGGLLCISILLFATDHSAAELIDTAVQADKFKLADLSFDLTEETILVTMLFGLVGTCSTYTTHPEMAQRYLAAPSTRHAQMALWFGTVACIVTWSMFFLIGSLLYSYYTLSPHELPVEIAQAGSETEVFPHFIATKLPPGFSGLILAGMCAAAMSSLDTAMNSSAMVIVQDIWVRFQLSLSDRRQMLIARVVSLIWGVTGVGVGIFTMVLGIEKALDFAFTVASILGGGILGMFMLGFFVNRAHARGMYVGLVSGVLISAWGGLGQLITGMKEFFPLDFPLKSIECISFPLHPWLIIVFSNTGSFGFGWIASLTLKKSK